MVNIAKEKCSSCNVKRMIVEAVSLKIILQSEVTTFFFLFLRSRIVYQLRVTVIGVVGITELIGRERS